MNTRKFISFSLTETVAKGLGWGLTFALALLMTPDAYGLVALIISVESIASMIMLFGLDRAIVRFYHDDIDNGPRLCGIVNTLWFFYAFVFLGLSLIFVYTNDKYLLSINNYRWLMLFCIVALSSHMNMRLAVDRAAGNAEAFLILRLGCQVLKVAAIFMLLTKAQGADAYLIASLAALSVALIFHYPKSTYKYNFLFGLNEFKYYSLFSLPFIPHIVSGGLLAFMDRFMLESMVGLSSVGQYSFAYVFGSGISFFYGIVAVYFEPYLYSKSKRLGDVEQVLTLYGLALLAFSTLASGVVLILITFFHVNLVEKGYVFVSKIVPIVLMAHILNVFYLQANFSLTVKKKTAIIAAGSVSCAILNYILNLFLIELYGVVGAAYATFISYLALSFILYSAAKMWYCKGKLDPSRVAIWVFAAAVLMGVSLWQSPGPQLLLLLLLFLVVVYEFLRQGGRALVR